MCHLTIAVLTALAFILLIAESESVKILWMTKVAALVLGALDIILFWHWMSKGRLEFFKLMMEI